MRHEFIGEECAAHADAADAGDPQPMQTRHEEQRRPDDRDQHGLAEIGLQHQRHDRQGQQHQSQDIARHVRRRAPSEKAQAARTTKAGFTNSDGWMPKIQRLAPLTSWPNKSVATISTMPTIKTTRAARRTWRGDRKEVANEQRRCRKQKEHLTIDEIEGRQAEPFGDRRTSRHA